MLAWVLWTFLCTLRVMLRENYNKKRMSQLAYAPVEYNYMETLAKTYIIPARQNQFIQGNIFNNAPIRRIALARNSNSALPAPLQRIHSGINSLI